MSSESECIRKDGVDVLLNSLVEGEVQAGSTSRDASSPSSWLMVGGITPSVIVLTQRTASQAPCGAEQMTSHRLRGAEVDLISVRTEHIDYRLGLATVADREWRCRED